MHATKFTMQVFLYIHDIFGYVVAGVVAVDNMLQPSGTSSTTVDLILFSIRSSSALVYQAVPTRTGRAL